LRRPAAINNNNDMENVRKRPVYLNLLKIRLPVGGVVSIIHRVTGVVIVLLTPLAVYLLHLSLQSPTGYDRTAQLLGSGAGRLGVLVVVWIFAQHFFSGVRHLLFDIDIGLQKEAARRAAWLTFVGSLCATGIVAMFIL
jgi:succinate dehydrogenase / fumarate reductase cytochrome b subunit